MNQKETNLRCVVIGSDHAGYGHKQQLIEYLREMGYEVLAVGATATIPVDYPDYAEVVGAAIP